MKTLRMNDVPHSVVCSLEDSFNSRVAALGADMKSLSAAVRTVAQDLFDIQTAMRHLRELCDWLDSSDISTVNMRASLETLKGELREIESHIQIEDGL